MEYNFRKLQSTDIFPMLALINKIGVKEFKTAFESVEVKKLAAGKNMEQVGFAVFFNIACTIIENLPKCENDIYNLLEDVSNLSGDLLRNMPMAEFMQIIIDFLQKDDFKDFFKVVSRLLK